MNVEVKPGRTASSTFVTVNDMTLLFSYRTVVAYKVDGDTWIASENVWSQTTGRHIGQLPDNRATLPHDEFMAALDKALNTPACGHADCHASRA
jgi:3',5'-cyclic AMP phosphodiesterase CpdA